MKIKSRAEGEGKREEIYQDRCKFANFSAINYAILSTFSGLFVLPEIKKMKNVGQKDQISLVQTNFACHVLDFRPEAL